MKKYILSTIVLGILSSVGLWHCQTPPTDYQEKIKNPKYFHQVVKKLTDVIVHDIFSPPVASRIYVYPAIAAYEASLPDNPDFQSLAGQLKALTPAPSPQTGKAYSFALASLHAYLLVGKKLVFSEEKITAFEKEFYEEIKKTGIPSDVYNRSLEYGQQVAQHIIQWMEKDNYKQTRTFPRYTVQDAEATWKPTPPAYMEGIEPNWNKIRTLLLDSASQFIPPRPTVFDTKKGSKFFEEMREVYEVSQKLTQEQKSIASFWDCNPYVSHHKGHVTYASKKITPGGHWIGIVKIVTSKKQLNFMQTIEAYTMVSIGLFESFISCWDEKWRSILVRPETVINQYIDENWEPLLQTPPFPEYTSGHSVISNTSAEILTALLGDNVSFEDSTEVEYGLPVRSFTSFRQAAQEAAISRLYGGIHYRPAIENGIEQGKKVGQFVLQKIKTRKNKNKIAQN